MGRSKPALPFGPVTMLERLLRELSGFAELIVLAGPEETYPIADLIANFSPRPRLLRDETAFAGPLTALVRGLRASAHPVAMVCACDLPLMRREVAAGIVAALEHYDAAIPVIGARLQPLCAAYHCAAALPLEALLRTGEERLTAAVEHLRFRRLDEPELNLIDPGLPSFTNVNTPLDYARALRLAGF